MELIGFFAPSPSQFKIHKNIFLR